MSFGRIVMEIMKFVGCFVDVGEYFVELMKSMDFEIDIFQFCVFLRDPVRFLCKIDKNLIYKVSL